MGKEKILKFFRYYLYTFLFGVFGLYIAGWVGLLLLGAWGWWCDRKKRLIVSKDQQNEDKDNKSSVSENLVWLCCLALPWWYIVTVIFTSLIAGPAIGITSVELHIETGSLGHLLYSDFELSSAVARIIKVIPLIGKYIIYLKNNGLGDVAYVYATLLSFLWVICILRTPKLFLLYRELYDDSFSELLGNKAFTLTTMLLAIISLLLFSFCFLGLDWFFPNQEDLRRLPSYSIPLLPIFFIITVFLVETLRQAFIKRNIKRSNNHD